MRWPWQQRREDRDNLKEAEKALEEVRAQWPDVHESAAVLRFHGKRNHFADSIRSIYQGGR
jgi:hypothetical protein